MKKKLVNLLGGFALLAILFLNVNVVLNGKTTAVLKFSSIYKVLAAGTTSGSAKNSGDSGSSDSGCKSTCSNTKSCESHYDSMIESGKYYCCATWYFFTGKQCKD